MKTCKTWGKTLIRNNDKPYLLIKNVLNLLTRDDFIGEKEETRDTSNTEGMSQIVSY